MNKVHFCVKRIHKNTIPLFLIHTFVHKSLKPQNNNKRIYNMKKAIFFL